MTLLVAPNSVETTHKHSLDTSRKHVLVVDDDPILRAQVVAYLANHVHATTEEAANGTEAFRVVSQSSTPFDLIISDLNMPDCDGIEFLREIARSNFTGSVVILSSERHYHIEMAEKIARYEGLDVVMSIAKPLTPESLNSLLHCLNRPTESA